MPINKQDPGLTILRYRWRRLSWWQQTRIYLYVRWVMLKRRLNPCRKP